MERSFWCKAVFTSTGKEEWNVAFHFEWEGQSQVYATWGR